MSNTRHKTMLSEHFSKEELTYSNIAVVNGLDNEPPPAAYRTLAYLATHLLEPLRRLNNGPIAILSGYRNADNGSVNYCNPAHSERDCSSLQRLLGSPWRVDRQ